MECGLRNSRLFADYASPRPGVESHHDTRSLSEDVKRTNSPSRQEGRIQLAAIQAAPVVGADDHIAGFNARPLG